MQIMLSPQSLGSENEIALTIFFCSFVVLVLIDSNLEGEVFAHISIIKIGVNQ